MKLLELVKNINKKDKKGVPNWMLGTFKRRSISFYNGLSDNTTDVFWIQSRNFTIDLRLPKEIIEKKELAAYTKENLSEIANYEGWVADSIFDGEKLFWEGGISYQNRNKWPEPAFMKKIGNCMLEFCPSNVYVEDWRLQNSKNDCLIGLRVVEEIDLETNESRRSDGGLIICGEFAAICLGREKSLEDKFSSMDYTLEDILLNKEYSLDEKKEYLNFETSIAKGSLEKGYKIFASTNPNRYEEELTKLDGFQLEDKEGQVSQLFEENGKKFKRIYEIDIIDSDFNFETKTDTTEEAKSWFKKESRTLNRYLDYLK